jgi:hypothetical protein
MQQKLLFCCVRFDKGLLWLQLHLQMCFCPPLGLMLGFLTLTVCKLCRLTSGADIFLCMTVVSGSSATVISIVAFGTLPPLTVALLSWVSSVMMSPRLG